MTLKTSKPMGNVLRIRFVVCLAPFLLSGCSLFGNSVQTCDEPQEYQESVSIPPLIVPDSLRHIQNKSVFNLTNIQESNVFAQESFTMPRIPDQSLGEAKMSNQIVNVKGDELSELLKLIDLTISNRQLEEQYNPIYDNLTSEYESNPSFKPCLDGPPKYFIEETSPRAIPSQTYTQLSDVTEVVEEEKSRGQKRREARKERSIDKQKNEGDEEEASSNDSEVSVEAEEGKLRAIMKVLTGAAIGVFTGAGSVETTLSVGQSMIPPREPSKPTDDEINDDSGEKFVEEEKSSGQIRREARREPRREARQKRRTERQAQEDQKISPETDKTIANRIRNLALSDSGLNDEQRIFIENMSDKQILEIAQAVMNEVENQDAGTETPTNLETINEIESTTVEEDGWFTQVKDQWTEGKAQREERREARQKRRAERQAQDD